MRLNGSWNRFTRAQPRRLPANDSTRCKSVSTARTFACRRLTKAWRMNVRQRNVLNVVYAHLAESKELLVLCSRASAGSRWVAEEVRWFLKHRGAGAIRLAYTEGAPAVGGVAIVKSSLAVDAAKAGVQNL